MLVNELPDDDAAQHEHGAGHEEGATDADRLGQRATDHRACGDADIDAGLQQSHARG